MTFEEAKEHRVYNEKYIIVYCIIDINNLSCNDGNLLLDEGTYFYNLDRKYKLVSCYFLFIRLAECILEIYFH